MVQGALGAAGAASLLAGLYWWLRPEESSEGGQEDDYDPSAMGFGDVKLAALIGAFLGWERMLVAVVVAVLAGALLGLIQLAILKENRLKFGPYLAIGALLALLFGPQVVGLYREMFGI
ncbi:MAG: prepilin peptidase [Deinococcus sp.]